MGTKVPGRYDGSLGVERPSAMPSVTEYVPEIVSFVETCVSNGFAYEDRGSVYFDTKAFESKGHDYGKLCPENIGNQGLMAEGEGNWPVRHSPKG